MKLNLPKTAMPLRMLFNTQLFSLKGKVGYQGQYASQFTKDARNIEQSRLFDTLAFRAQVFPPEGYLYKPRAHYQNHFRTRETHSREVARTAREIANKITEYYPELAAFGFADLCYACALGHDLGTPPESHIGESTIRTWFKENREHLATLSGSRSDDVAIFDELARYEGNANLFRFATSDDLMPQRLSYATLAGMIKYPFSAKIAEKDKPYGAGKNKMGFYADDADNFHKVATECGIKILQQGPEGYVYARHPVTFVVEAADDITYLVHDIVDALGFNRFSLGEVVKLLRPIYPTPTVTNMAKNEPEAYIKNICPILWEELAQGAAHAFSENKDAIFQGLHRDDLLNSDKGFSKINRVIRKSFEGRVLKCDEIVAHRSIFAPELMILLDAVAYTLSELDGCSWDANKLSKLPKKLYETLIKKIPDVFPQPGNIRYLKSVGFAHMLHYALDAIALVPRDRIIHDVVGAIRNVEGAGSILSPITRKYISTAKEAVPALIRKPSIALSLDL